MYLNINLYNYWFKLNSIESFHTFICQISCSRVFRKLPRHITSLLSLWSPRLPNVYIPFIMWCLFRIPQITSASTKKNTLVLKRIHVVITLLHAIIRKCDSSNECTKLCDASELELDQIFLLYLSSDCDGSTGRHDDWISMYLRQITFHPPSYCTITFDCIQFNNNVTKITFLILSSTPDYTR